MDSCLRRNDIQIGFILGVIPHLMRNLLSVYGFLLSQE